VDVGLGDVRQVVIDHDRQFLNVDAAGGDVRRHKNVRVATFEIVQRSLPRALGFIAVDGIGAYACLPQ